MAGPALKINRDKYRGASDFQIALFTEDGLKVKIPVHLRAEDPHFKYTIYPAGNRLYGIVLSFIYFYNIHGYIPEIEVKSLHEWPP